jgi:hypothetical protein
VADETPMAERLREAVDRTTTQVSCYARGISAHSVLHPIRARRYRSAGVGAGVIDHAMVPRTGPGVRAAVARACRGEHAEVGIRFISAAKRFAVEAVNKSAVPSLTRGQQFVSHVLAAAQQI